MPIRRSLHLVAILLVLTAPALAFDGGGGVNKDMVQLQTQVQQLQDAVARLQQSNDERMGVLKDLVQQSADSVNRMSVNIDTLQKQVAAQQAASATKVDQVSGQVQAVNDSLDEVKARLVRLEKAINTVDSQQQAMSATLQNLQPASTPQTSMPGPGAIPSSSNTALNTPPPAPTALTAAPAAVAPSARPMVDDLYKSAFSDFMAARYAVATSEFGDVIHSYPDAPLAGNSYFYLGEIDFRAARYAAAAKDYDKVLEQFPDNNKAPAAHLHKGEALLQLKQREAAVLELRSLIQRFPNSPEALQARTKLNGMGVPIKPRT